MLIQFAEGTTKKTVQIMWFQWCHRGHYWISTALSYWIQQAPREDVSQSPGAKRKRVWYQQRKEDDSGDNEERNEEQVEILRKSGASKEYWGRGRQKHKRQCQENWGSNCCSKAYGPRGLIILVHSCVFPHALYGALFPGYTAGPARRESK